MKVSSDNVKTALILAGVGIAAYAAYRAYRVAGGIKDEITENLTGAANYVGDMVSEAERDIQNYDTRVSNFWSNIWDTITGGASDEAYPEAGPIRAAQNAAIGEAIKVRYTDPSASFEQLSDPTKPFYNYGPAPSFGSDSILGSMPAPYSPDSFQGLAGPDTISLYPELVER